MPIPTPDLLALARTKFYEQHRDHYLKPVRFAYEATPRPCIEVHRIDAAPDVPPVTTYLVIERECGAVELVHAEDE